MDNFDLALQWLGSWYLKKPLHRVDLTIVRNLRECRQETTTVEPAKGSKPR